MSLSFPSLEQFDAYVTRLGNHDWTYDYSDDSRVWQRGQQVRDGLVATAKTHPVYQQAFDAYVAYIFPKNCSQDTKVYSKEAWAQREVVRKQAIEALRTQLGNEWKNQVVTITGEI